MEKESNKATETLYYKTCGDYVQVYGKPTQKSQKVATKQIETHSSLFI